MDQKNINRVGGIKSVSLQRRAEMANREYYDVIIVGGGPAGLSAAIYALRASMRTVLIEKACSRGPDNADR